MRNRYRFTPPSCRCQMRGMRASASTRGGIASVLPQSSRGQRIDHVVQHLPSRRARHRPSASGRIVCSHCQRPMTSKKPATASSDLRRRHRARRTGRRRNGSRSAISREGLVRAATGAQPGPRVAPTWPCRRQALQAALHKAHGGSIRRRTCSINSSTPRRRRASQSARRTMRNRHHDRRIPEERAKSSPG